MLICREEDWQLITRDGKVFYGELLPEVYANPFCIVMNFKVKKNKSSRRFVVPVMRDALDNKSRSCLLIKLRMN